MWLISISASEGSIACRASQAGDTSLNSGRARVLGKLIGIDLVCEVEGRVAS